MGYAMAAMGGVTMLADMASTLLTLIGNEQESRAQQTEGRQNALLAEQAAADAYARGAREAGLARREGTRTIAAQQVGFAASGLDPTVGTPLAVAAHTRAVAEEDARTLENNAAREAWGFKVTADRYRAGARLEAERLPMKQLATVLGGAGRMASRYDVGQGATPRARRNPFEPDW